MEKRVTDYLSKVLRRNSAARRKEEKSIMLRTDTSKTLSDKQIGKVNHVSSTEPFMDPFMDVDEEKDYK